MTVYFKNISKGKLPLTKLGKEIKGFVDSEPGEEYQLIIGSDSRMKDYKENPSIDLVSAIVIHRKGRGARYFWNKKRVEHVHSLKEKLYHETMASIDVAYRLMKVLKKDLNGQFETLEIHIDVGEKGPSREMIKELVGMVNGNGYRAKIKPKAFAASSVADKYT